MKGQFWGWKWVGRGHARTRPVVDILKVTQQGAALVCCKWRLWSTKMGCTLAPHDEYEWTVCTRQQRGLMSNSYDHLLSLRTPGHLRVVHRSRLWSRPVAASQSDQPCALGSCTLRTCTATPTQPIGHVQLAAAATACNNLPSIIMASTSPPTFWIQT